MLMETRFRKIFVILLLLLPVCSLSAQANQGSETYKILIIHPFHETSTWENEFDFALANAINEEQDIVVSVFHEYTAADLTPAITTVEDSLADLNDILSFIQPDVVISMFQAMHNLLLENRDSLYLPMPQIYVPATGEVLQEVSWIDNAYAVRSASGTAIARTLDMIKSLMPDLRSLYVFSGVAESDLPYLALFRSIYDSHEIAGETAESVKYKIGLSHEAMLNEASTVPEGSAIFFILANQDAEGNSYSITTLFPGFAEHASAPVFSFYDTLAESGIVGGNLTSAASYGRITAKMMFELLSGKVSAEVRDAVASDYIVNWPQLKRWHLAEEMLPSGTEILNKEFSFWELYRTQVIFFIGIGFMQTMMIIALVHLLLHRRKAEKILVNNQKMLEKSLREKEVLIKEIHHRVKNNMAIIMSFLNLQAMQIENKPFAGLFFSAMNRVHSMALIHEQAYRDDAIGHIDLNEYISSLVSGIIQRYKRNGTWKLEIDIQNIYLDLDTLIPLGIILNETVSNAVLHAQPPHDELVLRISLKVLDQEHVRLSVADNGMTPPSGQYFETADSIGLLLAKSLGDQLNGKMETHVDGGLVTELVFPLR